MMVAPDRAAMAIVPAIAVPAAIYVMLVVGDDVVTDHMVATAHSVMRDRRIMLGYRFMAHWRILGGGDLMVHRVFHRRLCECGCRKAAHGHRERGRRDNMAYFHCGSPAAPC